MQWYSVFRIRIGSAFDGLLDPDPHCECGSGSRRVKSDQKEEEKLSLKTRKNMKIRMCSHILGKELGLQMFNVRKIR
jgi:hypothetical protein